MVSAWPFAARGFAGTLTFQGSLRPGPSASSKILDHDVGGGRHQHVDRRQRLVFHVGAGMQVLVERRADDLGRDLAGLLRLPQRAAEIDPVERQDDVGLAQQFARRFAEHVERRHRSAPDDRSGTSRRA